MPRTAGDCKSREGVEVRMKCEVELDGDFLDLYPATWGVGLGLEAGRLVMSWMGGELNDWNDGRAPEKGAS